MALMVELLSCHPTLPDNVPLSSYRSGREVKVWKYNQALRAFREIVEKSGRNPKEFALHSLRIGGASTLAAGGDVSDGRIQKESRWASEEYKAYTVYNVEDAKQVSRKRGDPEKGVKRQPGEGTVWGSRKRKQISRKKRRMAARWRRNGRVPFRDLAICTACIRFVVLRREK